MDRPSQNSPRSERTTVRRRANRGTYDLATIHAILDEALICHVGFVQEGQPYVIPTLHARDGERLLIHGAAASRMLRVASESVPLCVTVTLLDGLVLARSAFHHSVNYRSVVLLGAATEIAGSDEKMEAMRLLVEHVCAGRWNDARRPNAAEFDATRVLTMPIDEASAKVRQGPPIDDEDDYTLSVWAGVLPLKLASGIPVADPRLASSSKPPAYVLNYKRG